MIIFRRQLKNNVKNEIIHDERDYESLAKFVEIIIDFDDKLYERVMKKHYNQSKDRAEFIYESNVKYIKSKHQSYIRNSKYIEFALMKLDITQQREEKNLKNKRKNENQLCYECKKIKHFVQNCRNENVMFRRQSNITSK